MFNTTSFKQPTQHKWGLALIRKTPVFGYQQQIYTNSELHNSKQKWPYSCSYGEMNLIPFRKSCKAELIIQHMKMQKMHRSNLLGWFAFKKYTAQMVIAAISFSLSTYLMTEENWVHTELMLKPNRLPVSLLQNAEFLFLQTYTCTWTVVAWMLYFLCALIHHCNSQEMRSTSKSAGQTHLRVSLWHLLHPLDRPTPAAWQKVSYTLYDFRASQRKDH